MSWDGQVLLPTVDLIEQSRLAIDELIHEAGRARIETGKCGGAGRLLQQVVARSDRMAEETGRLAEAGATGGRCQFGKDLWQLKAIPAQKPATKSEVW